LYRIESESGGGQDDATLPYLPLEMWLTIMSFVQVYAFFDGIHRQWRDKKQCW
jgi:hypothetical protein